MSDKVVAVTSFGYKHGIPEDAGFIIDARCLPNPYWVDSMRDKCGLDADVDAYVFSDVNSAGFLESAFQMILSFLKITKTDEIRVYVGCTGGQHRSVAFAERLGKMLTGAGYDCRTSHREAGKFRTEN